MINKIIDTLTKDFKLQKYQVKNTIDLLNEGQTVPFIARYRKEATGELDDIVLRELVDRLNYLTNLEEKKGEIKNAIDKLGKLTPQLAKKIDDAEILQEVADIYLPYKPKKRTRASMAREKGLAPLADFIKGGKGDVYSFAAGFGDSVEDAISGARDIIAEEISEDAALRKYLRGVFLDHGEYVCKTKTEEDTVYTMYYDYRESVSSIPSHRVLAIDRGEKDDVLRVKIEIDHRTTLDFLLERVVSGRGGPCAEILKGAAEDAYKRLILPSVENETRKDLTLKAQEKALVVFKENLRSILMQAPVKGFTVMGIDPAYRTGCKIAVVDKTGKPLDFGIIFPITGSGGSERAGLILEKMVKDHQVDIIAIGNGTASRETEIFVSEVVTSRMPKVKITVVNEAGASVYSASSLASEEFPHLDVTQRSAVSIARRLQDPLAELVKIDPKSIGVGQYQHDMNQRRLEESLKGVVEDCVNRVGVDLNTTSISLLSHVAGISPSVAANIVAKRNETGGFTNREMLKDVRGLGEKTYLQCAGFLRIPESKNILDNTAVHPESYGVAKKLLELSGEIIKDKTGGFKERMDQIGEENLSRLTGAGIPTLRDIIGELLKPGRDVRDNMPGPVFFKEVMKIDDLKEGMVLTGTVRNVSDFGAFIDVGVHRDGLVHISEMADRFVKNPLEVVRPGDVVKVRVIGVDANKQRISFSMKNMGGH